MWIIPIVIMSDPAAEPGAPTGGATNIPSAQDKSIAAEAKKRVPNNVVSLARAPDRIILRLNKYVVIANSQLINRF